MTDFPTETVTDLIEVLKKLPPMTVVRLSIDTGDDNGLEQTPIESIRYDKKNEVVTLIS